MENLFQNEENYLSFLKLFFETLSPIADVYAYSLLPNSFDFLLKIKTEKAVFTFFKIEGKFPDETMTLDEIKELSMAEGMQGMDILSVHISKQFSNLFSYYEKTINKQRNKKNRLFESAYKRVEKNTHNQLMDCISYIHLNPIRNNFTKDITLWKFNSYNAILSDKPTKLKRIEVIDIFGNKENYSNFHQEKMKMFL